MTLSNPAQYISGRTVQEQMNSLIDYVDQRAAEVATDAIAADVAQVHQDMLDADADATAAAASAAAAAGTLANAVKKTGEASQSIAGDIAVSGTLDAASIGSGSTPVVCGNLTAYGSVSLDDTTLQGNLSGADASALINLSGVGSVLVPTPTSNGEAATKKYVDDADALKISITDINNYAVGLTGNQNVAGTKTYLSPIVGSVRNFISTITSNAASSGLYRMIMKVPKSQLTGIRNHYVFMNFTRARDRAPDVFVIYTSSGSISGFSMMLRANTEGYTYVLSYDATYVYLYMITAATAADAYQLLCLFSSEGNAPLENMDADIGDFANIEGTEYGRLTP